jgi:ribonuclease Z
MKPLFHPLVVNDPFADPVLYLDFLFDNRALLFDIGDVRALPTRKLLRVSDLFVSHTHMDHFADFDWLLRLVLGREKRLRLFGPPGFIEKLEHKLGAYSWDLVHNYTNNLDLIVTELHPNETGQQAVFRCRRGFARESQANLSLPGGVLRKEPTLRVRAEILDHGIPCLGFTVEENQHVNIWKNRLQEMGLPVGAWLRDLKQAILTEQPDESPIQIWTQSKEQVFEKHLPLGLLKQRVAQITPGQKISYIVDISYSNHNIQKVLKLVENSHRLFVETTFLQEDAAMAAEKHHLTAYQAGKIAHAARVKQLIPINFSPRYEGRRQELITEAQEAFRGLAS